MDYLHIEDYQGCEVFNTTDPWYNISTAVRRPWTAELIKYRHAEYNIQGISYIDGILIGALVTPGLVLHGESNGVKDSLVISKL